MLCVQLQLQIFSAGLRAVPRCWVAAVAVYHGVECRHQSGDVTQHRVTTDQEAAHLDSNKLTDDIRSLISQSVVLRIKISYGSNLS